MTKQPHYATKLRLSRICRWLLALGTVKLCIFGALVAGYPLPELSFDLLSGQDATHTAQKAAPMDTSPNTLAAMDTLLAQSGQSTPSAQGTPESRNRTPDQAALAAAPAEDPQGSAAARAAAALTASTSAPAPASSPAPVLTAAPAPQAAEASTATAPSTVPHRGPATTAYPATDASATTAGDDRSWWSRMQQLKALPFPRLGVDQVAHAATLDTPPPPSLPSGRGASPFTPPAQIPSGLNPDGTPIPPRPSTAQPRPAGTSGPQLDTPAGGIPALLTPTTNVPAPRTDAYVAPEDPNRKQQELARREQEVLVLKQQMEQRLEELQAAERKVQGLLEEAKEAEAKKISRLSAIYINMKPKQAAKAIENMDERTAVKILAGMSPKQSGEILTYADPVKTAKLTELISRMRAGQ